VEDIVTFSRHKDYKPHICVLSVCELGHMEEELRQTLTHTIQRERERESRIPTEVYIQIQVKWVDRSL
jgi:hypothetical protein